MAILCDRCDSPRVVYFRLDMDWYDGGDLIRLNDPDDYLPDDPDTGDTLEIEGRYCIPCGDFVSTHTPAPAGVSAAPTSRDRPAGPAGAPIPTTSEPTCETCHRLLSCVGTCPKGCEQI